MFIFSIGNWEAFTSSSSRGVVNDGMVKWERSCRFSKRPNQPKLTDTTTRKNLNKQKTLNEKPASWPIKNQGTNPRNHNDLPQKVNKLRILREGIGLLGVVSPSRPPGAPISSREVGTRPIPRVALLASCTHLISTVLGCQDARIGPPMHSLISDCCPGDITVAHH